MTSEPVTKIYEETNNSDFDTASSELTKKRQMILIVYIFVYLIILIVGSIGNSLTFIIMQRGSLKHSSTCFYMAMLAVADTCKYEVFLVTSNRLYYHLDD